MTRVWPDEFSNHRWLRWPLTLDTWPRTQGLPRWRRYACGWSRWRSGIATTVYRSDKEPVMRQVLRGVQALHPAVQKQAEPLQLAQLVAIDAWLQQRSAGGSIELRSLRDRALVQLDFLARLPR